MKPDFKINKIKDKIANGNIVEALNEVLKSKVFIPKDELYHLSGRLSRRNREELLGIKRNEYLKVELNQIRFAFLELLIAFEEKVNNGELLQIYYDSIFESLPFALVSEDDGIDLLKYYNDQAKFLYENKIYENEKTKFDKNAWDEIFDDNDFKGQKEFIETITQDNQEVKYYTLESLYRKHNRIWLIGDAGVGKTTTLYNIYFTMLIEADNFPIPMLIQPQEFDNYDIDIFKSSDNIIETLIIIWLQNRGLLTKKHKKQITLQVYKNNKDVQKIIKRIEAGLKSGEIILLIDSYDELSRMSFQIDIFKKIFKISKKYICASRPETYLQHLHSHILVKIRSPWALPTVKQYLNQKLELS